MCETTRRNDETTLVKKKKNAKNVLRFLRADEGVPEFRRRRRRASTRA
jgi:hypothetical protein